MASTGLDRPGAPQVCSMTSLEKHDGTSKSHGIDEEAPPHSLGGDDVSIRLGIDSTHRKLKPRHIQLIGIGGFVSTI